MTGQQALEVWPQSCGEGACSGQTPQAGTLDLSKLLALFFSLRLSSRWQKSRKPVTSLVLGQPRLSTGLVLTRLRKMRAVPTGRVGLRAASSQQQVGWQVVPTVPSHK